MNCKIQILTVLIIIQFFVNKVNVQACGSGIVKFNIYTLNGSAVKDFDYEILPISKEFAEKFNYQQSGEILTEITDSIIDRNNKTLNNELKIRLEIGQIPIKGKIKSSINFTTLELLYFPIVLKITQKKKQFILLEIIWAVVIDKSHLYGLISILFKYSQPDDTPVKSGVST